MSDDVNNISVTVDEDHQDKRLDHVLVAETPDILSRSRIKSLLDDGLVTLNSTVVSSGSKKVRLGDVIAFTIPEAEDPVPKPQKIELDIVFEDDQVIVINKPAGLVVHPGAGNPDGTLVNALLYHCGDSLSGIGGVKRPGIVHRLDKDTSGLMMVAKTDLSHQHLSKQLADRTLSRSYVALVWGDVSPKKGVIDKPVGRHPMQRLKMAVNSKASKEAVTHYKVKDTYSDAVSYVECTLQTGRTHQIRVHMLSEGHPLVGDPVYKTDLNRWVSLMRRQNWDAKVIEYVSAFNRQALHAKKIGFDHPVTGKRMQFESDFPDDLQGLISLLSL